MYPSLPYSMSQHKYSSLSNIACPIQHTKDNDDKTVVTSNTIKHTHGLLDSGASNHSVAINANVKSSWPTKTAFWLSYLTEPACPQAKNVI